MKFFSHIRFLPVTIFLAVMILTIKITSIHEAVDAIDAAEINVSSANAQTNEQADSIKADKAPPNVDPKDQSKEKNVDEPKEAKKDEKEDKTKIKIIASVDGSDPMTVMVTQDPTLLTPSEIELLQQLSERRRSLEDREQELEMRTGLLTAAESRIDKKIKELNNLRITISTNIKTYNEQQDAKLLSLVKIYENMKPKDAARIFENLQLDTLLEVAERMKERKLAPIMAKMNAEKAREMTVEIRQLRKLPPTGG